MQPNKVYDEVIEFIASSSPQNVIAFRPSEKVLAAKRHKKHRIRKSQGHLSFTNIWQMARWISAELRQTVADRAKQLGEYCLIAEADTFYGCEVEHIISLKHGGSREPDNLAYALRTAH